MKVEKSKLSFKLELMDWKAIESNSQNALNDGRISMVVAEVLLTNARKHIKMLGGETNEEIDAKARKQAEANKTNST